MPNVVFSKDSGLDKGIIRTEFERKNIDARVFFWPLSSLDFFESVPENIHSWDIPERSINLPSYHDMNKNDQDRVLDVLSTLVKRN